jgi:hypothetical protein
LVLFIDLGTEIDPAGTYMNSSYCGRMV